MDRVTVLVAYLRWDSLRGPEEQQGRCQATRGYGSYRWRCDATADARPAPEGRAPTISWPVVPDDNRASYPSLAPDLHALD